MKVHVDTDLTGEPDDVCALAMLLKWPGVEITGITTVGDSDGRRAGYVAYVLNLAGRSDIPVAAGADNTSGHHAYELGLLDEAAYRPEPIIPAPGPVDAALNLVGRNIGQGATIVGIGPYTNFALFDTLHPGRLRSIAVESSVSYHA